MTVMWSIVGVSITAVLTYAFVWRERRLAGPRDFGAVSDQWIAEHRAHQAADGSG